MKSCAALEGLGKKYILVTNFKTFSEGFGLRAAELVAIHERVARDYPQVMVACALQSMDLLQVEASADVVKFAQHVDPVCTGAYTGKVNPEFVVQTGARGTLLNHSEYRLQRDVLRDSIVAAKRVGLMTIVCCESAEEGWSFQEFEPDLLAVEPPELIGGDISVSKSQADLIHIALDRIGCDKLLVGAGIKDREDVRLAVEYGARGVLVASGIVKAADPELALRDLLAGFPTFVS